MLTGLLLGLPTVIYPGAFDPGCRLLDVLAEKVGIFLLLAVAVCTEQQARPRDLRLRVLSWSRARRRMRCCGRCRQPSRNQSTTYQTEITGHLHAARRRCVPLSAIGRQGDPDRRRKGGLIRT